MVQISSFKSIHGLDLESNPFVGTPSKDYFGAPRSATTIADNAVINRQRMAGNRKGFNYFTQGLNAPVDAMWEYQTDLIQHQTDNTLWAGDGVSGTRTQYSGTYQAPNTTYRMDAAVGRGSLFFTDVAGVRKLDALGNTPLQSGMCKGLDTRVVPTGTGNGFASGFSKAAYRITWTRTDANGQVLRSDVSQRVIGTNNSRVNVSSLTQTAGTATVTTVLPHGFSNGDDVLISNAVPTQYDGTYVIAGVTTNTFTYAVSGSPTSPATTTSTITAEKFLNMSVSFTVPWDVQPNDSYEIWRTQTMSSSSADPGDTEYLVQAVVNAAAAGSTVTYLDTLADTILIGNVSLYTNATNEGATQGNSRPPMCTAMATYKDYLLFGNAAVDHQITLNCLAVINFILGLSSITLTSGVAGTSTYTFATTESVSAHTAQVFSGGVSNALNIAQTVQSLCHVISGDPTGNWYAEYTSGPNDQPGIFRIWARSPLSGQFFVTSDDTTTGQQFNPVLFPTGQANASSNDQRQNRLYYSKYQQPDHVPVLNSIDVGRLDQPIMRILAVRDAAYIIKQDGVYYLSGLVAPFSLIELDTTCHCVAPATAVTLNNQVYMLSNQGVVKVSISGVTVISFDIEPAIQESALPLANISSVAFGVAHEADRYYYLWLPTGGGDTTGTQCYVYHTFIEEWTRWTKPAMSGLVLNSTYALYIQSGLEKALLKQRRNGNNTDYSDETLPVTIISQTGSVAQLTWASTLFTPTAGITLAQGGAFSKVTNVTNVSGTTWNFTLAAPATFTAGAATATMPIYSHIRLSPNVCGEGGMTKVFYSVTFLLASNSVTQVAVEAATNDAPLMNAYPISVSIIGGWGSDPWGNVGWGDVASAVAAIEWQVDLPIPDHTGEAVTAGWYHSVSSESYLLAQMSVEFDLLAEFETA